MRYIWFHQRKAISVSTTKLWLLARAIILRRTARRGTFSVACKCNIEALTGRYAHTAAGFRTGPTFFRILLLCETVPLFDYLCLVSLSVSGIVFVLSVGILQVGIDSQFRRY